MLKKIFGSTVLVFLILLFVPAGYARDLSRVPEKGRVTMVDLGAKKCIPCKMMAPILEKLSSVRLGYCM